MTPPHPQTGSPPAARRRLGLAPSNRFDVPFVVSTCDAHGSPTGATAHLPNGLANGLGAADDGGDGDAHGAAAGGGVAGGAASSGGVSAP